MVTWGNNTTATFGKGTSAAASTTPAPATGFSFGAAPAANTQHPSTPPAASQPAPSLNPPPIIGTSNTTTTAPAVGGGLFGSNPAPAPTTGLFGAPAPTPATGGLFGAPAPATSGGLFGAPAPAPATTGLFGAPSPAAPSGGLFGATPQPAPAPFGQPLQPPQQQQYNPHQAALHAHQSASQRQETARIEEAIFNLHSKYSSTAADPRNPALASNNTPSSLCAFTAILYDALPPEHRSHSQGGGHLSVPKPAHISNSVWNEALARNPDTNELMPTPLVGAPALHSRIVSQQDKANSLAEHAKKLRETLHFLEKAAKSSQTSITHSNSEQEVLRRRLLEIMRKVEIIRCMNQPTQTAEIQSQQRLNEIIQQVTLVDKALIDLEERGKYQARVWRMRGATIESQRQHVSTSTSVEDPLQTEDKVALFNVLNDQRLGMERLGNIVNKDVRDAGILKEELTKETTGMKALPQASSLGGTAIFGGR